MSGTSIVYWLASSIGEPVDRLEVSMTADPNGNPLTRVKVARSPSYRNDCDAALFLYLSPSPNLVRQLPPLCY